MRIVGVVLFCGVLVFVTMLLAGDEEEDAVPASAHKESAGPETRHKPLDASGSQEEIDPTSVPPDETLQQAERENPGAREIREALDTPIQNFFASVSPVWVQIRRVLKAHGNEEWLEDVNGIISSIKDARRTIGFEGEYLLRLQNTLMESLWSASFSSALKSDLSEPLRILGERTEQFSSQ